MEKSFQNYKEWLDGVVYEDPWKAGRHNGISNSETQIYLVDNKELGLTAFQFGTRPLLTVESSISNAWKQKLLTLKNDILSNHPSPTGFYSLAMNNELLKNSNRVPDPRTYCIRKPLDGGNVKK